MSDAFYRASAAKQKHELESQVQFWKDQHLESEARNQELTHALEQVLAGYESLLMSHPMGTERAPEIINAARTALNNQQEH